MPPLFELYLRDSQLVRYLTPPPLASYSARMAQRKLRRRRKRRQNAAVTGGPVGYPILHRVGVGRAFSAGTAACAGVFFGATGPVTCVMTYNTSGQGNAGGPGAQTNNTYPAAAAGPVVVRSLKRVWTFATTVLSAIGW
jgi:hypothetical protein